MDSVQRGDRRLHVPAGPLYYVVVREGNVASKVRVGRSRREAERALRKIAVSVDEGAFRPQLNIRFADWAEKWLESLERKATTVDSYRSTMSYATEAFGDKRVRAALTPGCLALERVFARPWQDTGDARQAPPRARRVLQSAIRHGYAAMNPVRELPAAQKPRPEKKEAAYFTNEEIPRLFAELSLGVDRNLSEVALKTGMRQGELLAVRWGDVDLQHRVIRVRRSYTDGYLGVLKNHERRDVDLTADVVELLGRWWGDLGHPIDDPLVFPGETTTGFASPTTIIRRELYPAMARAGIARIGPTGEKRTFHSFRHTFAKRALETGAQITWLSRHLGHSTLKVTTDVYGHWERAERKRQAERLTGVFGI